MATEIPTRKPPVSRVSFTATEDWDSTNFEVDGKDAKALAEFARMYASADELREFNQAIDDHRKQNQAVTRQVWRERFTSFFYRDRYNVISHPRSGRPHRSVIDTKGNIKYLVEGGRGTAAVVGSALGIAAALGGGALLGVTTLASLGGVVAIAAGLGLGFVGANRIRRGRLIPRALHRFFCTYNEVIPDPNAPGENTLRPVGRRSPLGRHLYGNSRYSGDITFNWWNQFGPADIRTEGDEKDEVWAYNYEVPFDKLGMMLESKVFLGKKGKDGKPPEDTSEEYPKGTKLYKVISSGDPNWYAWDDENVIAYTKDQELKTIQRRTGALFQNVAKVLKEAYSNIRQETEIADNQHHIAEMEQLVGTGGGVIRAAGQVVAAHGIPPSAVPAPPGPGGYVAARRQGRPNRHNR